ncbi:MAG: SDR family oxidoreductase [Candidatus Eremiobacteraeota bacterium]|nr:SDR family oxidoreductase [Candidatus Eremiobacteraeota bacterium]
MILVVGATGGLGGKIAHCALSAGNDVRILVREGSQYEELLELGAQPAFGDLKDPSSLERACQGIDAVVTTANSAKRGGADSIESVDLLGNASLIDAAAAAGVQHFVFTSVLGANPQSPVAFISAKGKTEDHLRASGMPYTILEPNIFMDVWVNAIVDSPLRARQPVTLIGSGHKKHSFIVERDVASFALGALSNQGAKNKTIAIGGPRPLSWRDIVAVYELFLGYPVVLQELPPGSALPGAPQFMSDMLAFMDTYESPINMTQTASDFKVALTPVETFVRESVARWN